jgi:CHAT domain-containing protein
VIITGSDVNEAKIKIMSEDGELAGYGIIHFACHGFFNANNPAQSGLLLSEISGRIASGEDGNLSIEEAALLNLNAWMALLSACSTGLGAVKSGEMTGLARSFMVAGTKNVGVSLWEIDDLAAMDFMTSLYRRVKQESLSFREAYYQTRNEFRAREDKTSHPYYWAAFTMYE